jgi:site-specific recombinase XerD
MTGTPDYLAPYVRSFFEDHLTCRRNVSAHTLQSYRDGLKLLLRFAAQHLKRSAAQLRVTDITEAVVIDFLTDLERTRANAIQTRNHRLVSIRNLFEYIATREPQLLDHCHKILTIPRKRGAPLPEIGYLEKEQVTALLGAIAQDSSGGRRDYALLLFMYNTGARVQEVADTRVGWLTLRAPCKVELLGKGRKWRTCPLWESTAQHLCHLLDECGPSLKPDDHLFVNRFGRPLSRSGIADILDRHVRRAASTMPVLRERKVTPHAIRHTTAMHLLQSGVEVNVIRSWLGHVSIATTNRYIEIDLAMKAKALETCQLGQNQPPVASWHSDPDILEWLESL